nr:MAG TPA: hypothetical protein [Caudoviricetes sp.]
MTKKDIQRIKKLIKKCDDCKLNECINCGISWSEVSTIRRLLDAYIGISKENEKLKADNLEYQRIQDISDVRTYRKRYLEERRKEENDLLYPDADEIYERYYKIKEENEKMKNKDTNKVNSKIEKSRIIKKIYVSDEQIGFGVLTNWTGRKLDFVLANKINELVQAVNQLSKETEE